MRCAVINTKKRTLLWGEKNFDLLYIYVSEIEKIEMTLTVGLEDKVVNVKNY